MYTMTLPSMGAFGTNAYVLWDEEKRGLLIDAPCDADYIISEIDKKGISLEKILLTHGHIDHIGACARVARSCGAKICIHKKDLPKLYGDIGNVCGFFGLPEPEYPQKDDVIAFENDEKIECGKMCAQVIETPGHTSGSVCFLFEDEVSGELRLYTGDTLFAGSMGRTDMPDGDEDRIFSSLSLLWDRFEGKDALIFPGHGPSSTVEAERIRNRYFIYAHNIGR